MIIILILTINLVYAQPYAETVENRLTIEFHAVTGDDVVTLNLPKFFGKDADFVHNHPEHVEVTIDPETHIATMKSKDPNWRGIETVVFATEEKYLKEPEKKGGVLLPRNVTKVVINVSKEDIALETDAFTQAEFETILGNLTAEPIDVNAMITNTTLAIEINKELKFNVSYDEKSPKLKMMWKIKRNTNMTAARYKEASDIITFSIIIFIIFAFAVVILYIYHGYSEEMKNTLFAPRKIKKDLQKKILEHKAIAIRELTILQRRVNKEKANKLYRECTNIMNKFLADGLNIRGSNIEKINQKLTKLNLPQGVIAKLNIFLEERKTKVYSGKELTTTDVNNYISFLKSIINKI
jgi:flagellar biosynthesis/type III secretory pathway chaperone